MILYLAAVLVGAGVAFACVWLYRLGVKDGMNRADGRPPAPIIQPKNPPEELEGWKNFLGYNPYEDKK